MVENVFTQIAILLLLSSVIGVIFVWLRQPLILAFIAVGILVGPSVLGIVYSASEVDLLAKIGITLLLFIVGLKLDFQLISTLGKVSLFTGLGQVIFTASMGFLIALALGLSYIAAVYVSVALTFSSTIIIIKLLSDKDEIDSLYGRIAVGFLIVQDIVVILAIIVLSSFGIGKGNNFNFGIQIFLLILRGLGLLFALWLIARYVFPKLLDKIAFSRELLIIFAISWAVILASVAELMGFSKEIGGFLAGVSLASTVYKEAIASRLETLPLKQIECVISTIPHREVNLTLIKALYENHYEGKIALTVYSETDISAYSKYSIDLLLAPYKDAAYLAAQKLSNFIKR
ncbi:MAG: cation:proton antiporter [Pseudomonadota bacterium]